MVGSSHAAAGLYNMLWAVVMSAICRQRCIAAAAVAYCGAAFSLPEMSSDKGPNASEGLHKGVEAPSQFYDVLLC
jgi:hypothetical protein